MEDDPRLLQEVRPHVGPDDVAFFAEAYLDILPKATAVVVSGRFCVPNRLRTDTPLAPKPLTLFSRMTQPSPHLHYWVRGQDLLLHAGLLRGSTHHSKVSHGELGRDRFPRSGLSADDDGLVLLLPAHVGDMQTMK